MTVTNATSVPLFVEQPFSLAYGNLGLAIRKGDSFLTVHDGFQETNNAIYGDPRLPHVNAVLMQPGEQRELSLRTDDALLDARGVTHLTADDSLPLEAGRYRFSYGYAGGATVDFDVVQPVVRRIILPTAPLSAAGVAKVPPVRPWRGPLGEVEWEGKRYVVASFREEPLSDRPTAWSLAPFVRLETLEAQFPSVGYTRDKEGTITFIWAGSGGEEKQLAFRKPKPTWIELRHREREQAK
jgi:hypothetical protein